MKDGTMTVKAYRSIVRRLEDNFNTHRHACVSGAEAAANRQACHSLVAELLAAECSRKSPEDVRRTGVIVDRVLNWLEA